ncbi:hypothetical protein VRRI112168_00490 [Vreelandella rituensis]|uniref:Uncharacterized protein n=1 Tax=Vreelandella rituensis TaxID=2282306 RepID=A0A368UA01_9GAMM|nr:hypothetical protein [Halomonas rituensis]RCV93825.1 hypothetical protein DU506_01320 [Halomonas rituensis]
MGRQPELNLSRERIKKMYLDLGPSMLREDAHKAVAHAKRQKEKRQKNRGMQGGNDAPFEMWRLFPGNKSLDMQHLVLKYQPETAAEVDALGDYLWRNNLIHMLVAHDYAGDPDRLASADQLYASASDAAEMYVRFMQGLHYLWRRCSGARYAADEAGSRGLSLPFFLDLLSYGCADVLLEPRMRFNGERGWVALAVVHDAASHWQAAVMDNDTLFRRAIPGDDMHTARREYAEICYELLDSKGEVALWETLGDAFADLQPLLGRDRYGHQERLHDIRIHVMAQRALYVEMIDPAERYSLFRTRWAKPEPGVIHRPLRHRLFLLDDNDRPGEEVGFYVAEDLPLAERVSEVAIARMMANSPGGTECYGTLPKGIRGYSAPLNGHRLAGPRSGRTQADSVARTLCEDPEI